MSRLDPSSAPRGTLRGARWILVVVGVFFAAVAVLQIGEVLRSRGVHRVGDGQDPATYGYPLDHLTIDRRWLAATMPKDNLTALESPCLLTAAGADLQSRRARQVPGLSRSGDRRGDRRRRRAYPCGS
ncbi:MAG: hypothetical protein R3D98_00395 [Candidatus Krumholzibacteriia bacterium]